MARLVPARLQRTRPGDGGSGAPSSRRTVLRGICGAAAIASLPVAAGAATDRPRSLLAQPGDLLVRFDNGGAGPIVNPADVGHAAPPLLAWPFDPTTKTVRDGSRLNLVLLLAFDPSSLAPAERARAADGIVAYTAICTHQACWVTDWLASKQVLQCPCHQSQYDPRRGADVVSGPAPRPLPALPLHRVEGRIEVREHFNDRVGAEAASG